MLRIFLWHLAAFVAGVGVIALYFGYKIAALPPEAAIASIAILVVGFVFAGGWGLACALSCALCMLVSWLRKRRH